MDETNFSEDTTLKQPEHLPYDGDFSQRKLYNQYNFTLKNAIPDASDQIISTVDDPQEKATGKEIRRNVDTALTLDMTENGVKKQCDTNLQTGIPATKGTLSKSNISDILLHHLSKEEFLKGQGINSETLPEISSADSFDEAIVKDIILHYVKNSWPKEESPELTDQLNPKRDGKSSNKPSCSPTTTEESTSDLENSNFLTKTDSLRHKQKSSQGQTPQKQQTEKTISSNGFICGQGQVRDRFSNFSKVETTEHVHQEHLKGRETKTSLFQLAATSQKDPTSSSYIFQKLSQGEKMCQKLKAQTDQLKTKVEEFSKSITQDSPYHLQDKRLVLEKLQGHLGLLEQEFLANKQKHLTLKQQALKHESPAVSDFDPERKVEGELFKLEMLLEDVKEKTDESKQTSVSTLVSSPTILDDAASTPLPPSKEEDPNNASGRQSRAETTSWSCAFCRPVLEWKQKMEKKGHQRIICGRFPIALQEKALCTDSILSPDTGHSCCSASGTGLQSNQCEACSAKICKPSRVCRKEPLKEFHYRYNTPGQNYLNHNEISALVQLSFLHENENSSLSCSKPKWICSHRANFKSSQDEHELIPGKKNLKAFMTYSSDHATPSPHPCSCRISGSKSLPTFSSIEETESEVLNSSLDHALRTATILKETTDRMIRTIAEDLAKVQRWRSRMKY